MSYLGPETKGSPNCCTSDSIHLVFSLRILFHWPGTSRAGQAEWPGSHRDPAVSTSPALRLPTHTTLLLCFVLFCFLKKLFLLMFLLLKVESWDWVQVIRLVRQALCQRPTPQHLLVFNILMFILPYPSSRVSISTIQILHYIPVPQDLVLFRGRSRNQIFWRVNIGFMGSPL